MTQFVYYPVVMYPDPQNSIEVYQMNFTRRADIIQHYKNNERYYFKHEIGNDEPMDNYSNRFKIERNDPFKPKKLNFTNIINKYIMLLQQIKKETNYEKLKRIFK